jgi:hypothetical protein
VAYGATAVQDALEQMSTRPSGWRCEEVAGYQLAAISQSHLFDPGPSTVALVLDAESETHERAHQPVQRSSLASGPTRILSPLAQVFIDSAPKDGQARGEGSLVFEARW